MSTPDQSDYIEDAKKLDEEGGRMLKMMLCASHMKTLNPCKYCDGKDEREENCQFYKGKGAV